MGTLVDENRKDQQGVYRYKGYRITNQGYHPPDGVRWWEAVNEQTECADYHAHTRAEIIALIDDGANKEI